MLIVHIAVRVSALGRNLFSVVQDLTYFSNYKDYNKNNSLNNVVGG